MSLVYESRSGYLKKTLWQCGTDSNAVDLLNMTYPTPTNHKFRPCASSIVTGIFNVLILLTMMLLCGCQTTPTTNNDLPYKPGPQARSVFQNDLLDIQLGDASYFRHADAQAIVDIVEQTRADLMQTKLITASPKSWLVLWHHPDSPTGRQLLAGTKRDPAMRGITNFKHHAIVLVGVPTPSSMNRWQQIIRHETVHAMMFDTYGKQAVDWPWWLTEGIATLWEIPPVNGMPAINPWRLPMLQYLERHHQPLLPKHLFESTGRVRAATLAKDYARAWALVYCLYQHHPDMLKQCMQSENRAPVLAIQQSLQQQIKQLSQSSSQ
jgi:hypothetical protein